MEEPDSETIWWRCAYYAYLDSERAADLADDDEATEQAVRALQDTVSGFLEGQHNFGTLKYRMDNASAESGSVFPPRSVSLALSDLALGVPIDDLEPALRRATQLPEGPGEAKGTLMDLEDFIQDEVSRGDLERSQARPERWPELMAALWHIQEPTGWPLFSATAMRYLSRRGEVAPIEPAHDYAEYAGFMRRLSEQTGADLVSLEHLLSGLEKGEIEVPGPEECFRGSLERGRELEAEGLVDRALAMYERALSLRPRTPEALRRKADIYEGKGLIMAAIGEMEALVEIEPEDLPAHRKLILLYKGQHMVREHNIEVRRFKAIREKKDHH
jgi:tetratricopeptide (TPR) repeat protein